MVFDDIPPYSTVIYSWEDAYASGQDASSIIEGLNLYKPYIRKSLGYYIGLATNKGRSAYLFASDDDRQEEDGSGLGNIIQIPADMVTNIEVVDFQTETTPKKKTTRK